ncbi:uncharacterized protein LOC133143150 [Syngnathus typhle]|uniref:uncharacterized protein LOC133143150 n=1 Tax=Syngnathus typhle TaxID=161592 RepID=UPI002A6ABA68|nr:uncharacterized protein LOC133143150 [Syngnathus typhle]
MLHVTVEGKPVKMLVDTGATYSSINTALPVSSLSKKTTTLVGFSGQPRTLPFTKPLETVITRTGCRLWHKYIHSTDTPINLMGRDLLSAVQARILCGPEGVIIQFPDGISIQCSQQLQQHGQWLMAPLPAEAETATIYWARLEPETPAGGGVFSTYLLWKPWICSLAPYHPPVDPLHCTLYYDRKSDDVYRDLFEEIEGHMWDLTSSCILIGKEGVAAATELTPEQMQWFKMTEKGVPHISLALAPGHEARELGSMVKHLLLQTDWRKTHIPNLYWSESQKAYQIKQPMVDSGLLEMMLVSRTHGRVLTDHAVSSFVASAAFTLTPLRQTRLLKILTAPNVNYVHSGVNMADQLLVGPHECASKVQTVTKVRPDLYSTPLGHGRVAFTDGCCWRDRMGSLHAAAAAVEWRGGSFQPLKVMKLNTHPSAQAAEVFALVLALRQCKGEAVTIYSDSAYAVSAALIDLVGWLQNGFTTARGSEIAHKDLMLQLFEALKYPSEVAIVKVPGHSKADTLVARGNRAADELAKQTAGYGGAEDMMVSRGPLIVDGEHPDSCLPLSLSHADLCAAQGATSPEQKSVWLAAKAVKRSDGLWVGPKGQPALPEGRLMSEILTQAHTPSHVGPHAMMIHLRSWWHPKLSDVVWKFVADCESCQTFNARPTLKPKPGLFQPAPWPGAEVIIDFTDMSTRVNGKRFLLVMVDAYSGWPEAYPCSKEDSTAVIKALITHYIPTHGFPALIRSDNGTHFNNKALAKVESILGLKHRFGCVYHPQSQGGVERMNRTLKEKLAKIMAQTTMNWLQPLPLALLSVRQSVNRRTGFAPFELMTGRLMPGPATTLVPPEDVTVPNLSHAAYWSYLSALVSSVSAQIGEKSAAAAAEEGVSAEKQLTPYVYVRVISRKWTDPRWKGPFRVLARTSHAAQLDFKGRRWYHYSQLRPAPEFVPSG